VHRMITMHAHPRQTDGRTNIMAIGQQFFLMNTSHAKTRTVTRLGSLQLNKCIFSSWWNCSSV